MERIDSQKVQKLGVAMLQLRINKTTELQKLEETCQKALVSYTFTLLFSWLFPFQLDFYGVVFYNPSVGQQKSEN